MNIKIKDPILITGPAKSRTSMTAGIFYYSGAWGGRDCDLIKPNQYNVHGQFENPIIRQRLKEVLKRNKLDPLGQYPLPTSSDDEIISEQYSSWRKELLLVFVSQGLTRNRVWFYKGAKMILLWRLWSKAFPDAIWFYVKRPDDLIIDSCLRVPYMRAYKDRKGWQEWIDEHKRKKEEMIKSGIKITDIDSESIACGNFEMIKKEIEDLGLSWNEKIIDKFVIRKGNR